MVISLSLQFLQCQDAVQYIPGGLLQFAQGNAAVLAVGGQQCAVWGAFGINKMPGTNIVTVYGETDPSHRYIPFLETKNLPNVEIVKVDGADHNFKGMMEQFIELSEKVIL